MEQPSDESLDPPLEKTTRLHRSAWVSMVLVAAIMLGLLAHVIANRHAPICITAHNTLSGPSGGNYSVRDTAAPVVKFRLCAPRRDLFAAVAVAFHSHALRTSSTALGTQRAHVLANDRGAEHELDARRHHGDREKLP